MSSTFCLGQFIISLTSTRTVTLPCDVPQVAFLQRGRHLVHIYCAPHNCFGDLSQKQSEYLSPLLGPVSSCSTPPNEQDISPNDVALVKLHAFLVTKNSFAAAEVELSPIWNYSPDVFFSIPHFTSETTRDYNSRLPAWISTSLQKCKTNMKPHQISALKFLLKNEDSQNNKPESLWYHHDNAWLRSYFEEDSNSSAEERNDNRSQGSILADDMGLGKTLTTLAFILATSNNGRSFQQADPNKRSAATLVICPLATLSNWKNKIDLHFRDHAIPYKVFHGDDRKSLSREDLQSTMLILTTYEMIGTM
ncbi:hypothetical protein PTTG_30665 [Puccinia triticina 1-1 BBBD Race 1]|uniref:SNF2_N domain-containing protein n=1 Tax=Puccinia triticina (isolate 1-1 / race 1 (BBBD)) TaxID=630390 RepID=A0A180FXU4_PUCT1|nr:hypothetical protein PTTG_30665 [Puccinia triticina 1-1 BBBD Race 1]